MVFILHASWTHFSLQFSAFSAGFAVEGIQSG